MDHTRRRNRLAGRSNWILLTAICLATAGVSRAPAADEPPIHLASATAAPDTSSPTLPQPPADSAAPCIAKCEIPRAGDQIWLVSTRCLGCACGLIGAPGLQFWRYEKESGWKASTLDEFLAADNPQTPTNFYVHGNFKSAGEAFDDGLAIYGQLAAQAAADRPMRFVIWSWPTDRGKHPVQLTRMHAYRSDTDAYYLGWLVNRIDHRVKIGLAGYSFGARVVTGAIHLLAGGELIGQTLAIDAKAPHQTVRAVLLAAAEDSGSLYPGGSNGMALPYVERMLLLNNGCDNALEHYPLLDKCSRPQALGYVGLATSDPKIEQLDVCCEVGKKHDWTRYWFDDSLVARMLPFLYLDGGQR